MLIFIIINYEISKYFHNDFLSENEENIYNNVSNIRRIALLCLLDKLIWKFKILFIIY